MVFLAAYIASVVGINYAFGALPQFDIVWSAWAGLIFVLRDMVQVRYGHWSLAAMAAACGLSYLLADPHIAIASATAFAVSETIDWIVFTVTGRPLRDRLWISAAASIPADTLIFFGLIGLLQPAIIATSLASKFAGVSAVWLIMRGRQAALVRG